MAILIEGPDNSGKSTLAKKLSEALNYPIVHAGGPGTKENFEARLHQEIITCFSNVIMDRSFIISESIYGPICRNENLFHPREWIRKLGMLNSIDTLQIIFCLPPKEIVLNTKTHKIKIIDTPLHLKLIEEHKDELYNAYYACANAFRIFTNANVIDPLTQSNELVYSLMKFIGNTNEI